MRKFFHDGCIDGVSGLFSVSCDIGDVDGADKAQIQYAETDGTFSARGVFDGFCIQAQIVKKGEVYVRRDAFTNTSDAPIKLYKYRQRFLLEGGRNLAYTQYNSWLHESEGAWQDIVSGIRVANRGTRMTDGGTPFLGVWNESSQSGVAFHMLPNARWSMEAFPVYMERDYSSLAVEMGIDDGGLHLAVLPGETISLPEIIFFKMTDKISMDSYKLHRYIHENMPRKKQPVLYNCWLCNFDDYNFDLMQSQMQPARDLGVEYFVIDAGWFGKDADWSSSVGDWTERTEDAFCGRMRELADAVRAHNMRFGLWMEPERASENSIIAKTHPEFFFRNSAGGLCLNFALDKAREYITKETFRLIDTYGVEFFKFDFNATAYLDTSGAAFYRYFEGHRKYIEAVRAYRPDIYLSCCASGGMRMELSQMRLFDSVWMSDNEDPYDQIRIYRDTLLRLAPSMIEKWAAVKTVDAKQKERLCKDGSTERLIAASGPIWDTIVSVPLPYMCGFLSDGILGFSCNLNELSAETLKAFGETVEAFKKEREFYRLATCRVLCKEQGLTALQFANAHKSVIKIYAEGARQNTITVYPALETSAVYTDCETERSGAEIMQNGIKTSISYKDRYHEITLQRIP